MPPKPPKNKTVETLKHDEARRKNIPTAEHQSVMAEEEKNPIQVAYERRCKACGRQFVEAPKPKLISQATKDLIDKLLLEKIPLAGIVRVCNVSETCLQDYVNRKYESIPRQIKVSYKKRTTDHSVR